MVAMRSLVYYYTHLPQTFGLAASRLTDDPATWLPQPATPANHGWTVSLHADGAAPAGETARTAVMAVGPATTAHGALRRLVRWRAADTDAAVPMLEADLELAPLPGYGCQLSLIGSYRAPLTAAREAGDRLLGHRVVEACVRRFVLDLAERLEASTLPA